jgi:hypothetical protein
LIRPDSSLREVAFEVCTALDKAGLKVVLVGGSAATFYAPEAYQSMDLDFVVRFAVDQERENKLVQVLSNLQYRLSGNTFVHAGGSPFTVEFPKGPASVGDEVLQKFDTVREGARILVIVSPTDCIRDRLAHYFYWNDRTALAAAIGVAKTQRQHVNKRLIQDWAKQLARESRFEYPDIAEKAKRFLAALSGAPTLGKSSRRGQTSTKKRRTKGPSGS